jgi:hypothetical protein
MVQREPRSGKQGLCIVILSKKERLGNLRPAVLPQTLYAKEKPITRANQTTHFTDGILGLTKTINLDKINVEFLSK